jgi:hypothetical protein
MGEDGFLEQTRTAWLSCGLETLVRTLAREGEYDFRLAQAGHVDQARATRGFATIAKEDRPFTCHLFDQRSCDQVNIWSREIGLKSVRNSW